MFVNTLPNKLDLDWNLTFNDFVKYTTEQQRNMFRHSKYPYDKLLEKVRKELVGTVVSAKNNKTRSELLTDNTIPVYTLGVYNRKKSNDEELKKMFAIARQTNAECFLLDEVEDYMTIVSQLAADYEIISLEIYPDSISKDGSEKTVQLELQAAGETISVQVDHVRMAQEKAAQETVVKEEVPELQIFNCTNC